LINIDVQCTNCHTEFHWIYANDSEMASELDMNDCPECGIGVVKGEMVLEFMEENENEVQK